MNILYVLIDVILIIYLTVMSYTDIKTKTISLKISIIIATIFLLIQIIIFKFHVKSVLLWCLCGCVVGTTLLILAFITRENIGYGDGIVVLVIGLAIGLKSTFIVCTIGFLLSAIVACFFLIRKKSKKTSMPFIPFIYIGYIFQLFAL